MTEITTHIAVLTIDQVEKIARDAYSAGQRAAQVPEKAWTLKECAAFLDVSEETVSTLAQNGQIPCQRVGRKLYRFHPGKVAEWVANREK